MNALVVDDSLTMRRILKNLLSGLDIDQVDEAADGERAVVMATLKKYDFILMDWNMPKMLGVDAVRQIRASGNKVPILMVTTEAEKRRVIEALKDGANNYVVKPFNRDTLLSKIEATLKKASG